MLFVRLRPMVIKQLKYLTALAREKHWARAAAACDVSQPTLSAAIRQLEEDLGVPMVERGQHFKDPWCNRGSRLTHIRCQGVIFDEL